MSGGIVTLLVIVASAGLGLLGWWAARKSNKAERDDRKRAEADKGAEREAKHRAAKAPEPVIRGSREEADAYDRAADGDFDGAFDRLLGDAPGNGAPGPPRGPST